MVSTAKFESLGSGRFRVVGVLDAATVPELLEQSLQRFEQVSDVRIDLGGIAESDSSGLALMIEWVRIARRGGKRVHFENIPAQICALARISEVEDLLSLNGCEVEPIAAAGS